jgi:RNA polymerase sigma factor FliA
MRMRIAPTTRTRPTETVDPRLWDRFFAGEPDARSALIEHYEYLVRIIAKKVRSTLPRHISEHDLYACGIFGLIEAVDRFQPDKNVKFENFAYFRIRGAMIDELRSMDWVPRAVRFRSKAMSRAREQFTAEHMREPTDEELADRLEIDMPRFYELEGQAHRVEWLVSLNDTLSHEDGDGSTDLPSGAASLDDCVVDADELDGIRRRLGSALAELPERQQLTLTFYYLYEMTLAEVGEVMGVSESRVCQIQTKALGVVREILEPTHLEPA